MIVALVALAFLAGAGVGIVGGIVFARSDQGRVFALMTSTVDKLTTSALFPGLKGAVEQPVGTTEEIYASIEEDAAALPSYLRDGGEDPWDTSTMARSDV